MNKAMATQFPLQHIAKLQQNENDPHHLDTDLHQLRTSLRKIESLMDRFSFSLHEIQAAFQSPFMRQMVIRTFVQQKTKALQREALVARTGRPKFQLVGRNTHH